MGVIANINKFPSSYLLMPWPKGRKHTEKEKKEVSKSVKKYFSNPLSRKKHSIAMRNPDVVRKIDRARTKWWREHPNIRKEKSIEVRNLFMEHPEKFKKFLKYGSNPALPQFKTKQGFKVRSRGEQTIANFLHDNKIKAFYEKKVLIFKEEGQICVPDFWLPHYKTYIEFYGGHPKAWKKKVLKNKLYKKHKIPCIFITPAELRDLEYYLGGA